MNPTISQGQQVESTMNDGQMNLNGCVKESDSTKYGDLDMILICFGTGVVGIIIGVICTYLFIRKSMNKDLINLPSNEVNLVQMSTQEAIIINQHGPGVDIEKHKCVEEKQVDEQERNLEDKKNEKEENWGMIVTDGGYTSENVQQLQEEYDHEDLYIDKEQFENADVTTKGTAMDENDL